MAKDERLLPLPTGTDLSIATNDIPPNYSPSYDEDPFGEKRSLREYFNVIYKRLWLIITLAVLVTSAVAFYMFRLPTQYEASSEVLIEPKKPKTTAKDAININFGNDQFYWNTQIKLIQSPGIMQGAVVKLGLHRDPAVGAETAPKGIIEKLSSAVFGEKADTSKQSTLPTLAEASDSDISDNVIDSLSPPEKLRAERAAAGLLGGLSVVRLENTNLFAIKMQNTNPELATKVAEAVANVFIESEVKRELASTQKQYDDLVKSVEDLKGTIGSQEQERVDYMQKTGMPLFEGKGQSLNAERLTAISQQWLNAIEERRKLEARYEAALSANSKGEATSIPDIQESKIYQEQVRLSTERRSKLQDDIRDIDHQVQQARTDRDKLLVKYTPDYPEVITKEKEIASLLERKENTEKEVSKTIDREQKTMEKNAVSGALVGLKAQLETVRKRELESQEAYNREVASANQQGQAETRLMTLTREIETSRNLLDTLTQRQKEKELELNTSRPDNISVSKHSESAGPVGPQRVRNIIIALLISLTAGIGLAFLLDYVDDSVKSSDDISRYVGLPTLAMIPHYKGIEKRAKAGKLLTENGNGNSIALATLDDNRSVVAESYRHLRTSLLFSSAGKPPQVVLVTSSQPSEGKTTTAINTAVTLAQAGADVILLDCDLRRPRLHHHFQLDNVAGITNYLSGDSDVESLMKKYPRVPNLRIITSGPIPPNPAELLSSNEMRNLLQQLRGTYKHIIVDSPPAISFTDAAILSTLADGVVIVAMANKSSLHLIRRFKQRLQNLGARIYGVVLNGIKPNSLEYGYYGYGYNYHNYYGNTEDDSTAKMDQEVEEFISESKR
jgi:succinoglycan biosynthesis transport protein ExoP